VSAALKANLRKECLAITRSAPRPSNYTRGQWKRELPNQIVNGVCDLVDNLEEVFGALHEGVTLSIIIEALKYRFAGGERDLVRG